ncbi:MAG: hypothetical protein RL748_1891 [Pseudomonadota bacterium]|jgi:signal transduction histidine kinase
MRPGFSIIPEHDTAQSLRVRRFLVGTISYLLIYLQALMCWWFDYVSTPVLLTYTGLLLLVNFVFYTLLRSGWNLRCADPSLTLPQLVVGVSTGFFIMYFSHQARIIFGLMALPVFLFGIFRFRQRDFYLLTGFTMVGYTALILLLQANYPEEVHMQLAMMIGFAMCLMFFQMSKLSGYIAHMRQKISEKNRELERRNHDLIERSEQLQLAHAEVAQTLSSLRMAQEELIRKEKLAALGALVAGVAHEINTPIGNSLVVVSLLDQQTRNLQQAMQPPHQPSQIMLDNYLLDAHSTCEILQNNLQRAADLVTSFKQVATDQTSSQRRSFDLAELVAELKLMLPPQANAVELEFRIDPALELESYPGPLGQAMNHLLNNAFLHAFDGPGRHPAQIDRICISARALDPDWIELVVQDNGAGIARENLPRIFDPFFTTRFGTGSSGLGLNITHNIVTEVLGGRIDAQSDMGQGSRFVLHLPKRAPQRQPAGHTL